MLNQLLKTEMLNKDQFEAADVVCVEHSIGHSLSIEH